MHNSTARILFSYEYMNYPVVQVFVRAPLAVKCQRVHATFGLPSGQTLVLGSSVPSGMAWPNSRHLRRAAVLSAHRLALDTAGPRARRFRSELRAVEVRHLQNAFQLLGGISQVTDPIRHGPFVNSELRAGDPN